MPFRPCITCGTLINGRSYCAAHEPRSTPHPMRAGQRSFRQAVLAFSGGVCAHCGASGVKLEAHHTAGLITNDPRMGVALCVPCHQQVEREKRAG
jgi:hypothetical protein